MSADAAAASVAFPSSCAIAHRQEAQIEEHATRLSLASDRALFVCRGPAVSRTCLQNSARMVSLRPTHTHTHAGKRHCKSFSGPVHCRPLTKYSIVVSRMKLGVTKQTVSPMQPANYIGSEGRRSGENWRERESCVLNITSRSEQMSA